MNLNHDYRYFPGVEVDYREYYPCANGSDCCKDDYCRCRQIQNIKIAISFGPLFHELDKREQLSINRNKKPLTSKTHVYCLDRILRHHKIYDGDNWDAAVESGYYGQELGAVSLAHDLIKKINYDTGQILSFKNDSKKIKYVLKLEYGMITDRLVGQKWQPATVRPDEINLSNENHLRKIDAQSLDFYMDYPYYICLCEKINDTYRLIDGYHRFAANQKKKTISILYFEQP